MYIASEKTNLHGTGYRIAENDDFKREVLASVIRYLGITEHGPASEARTVAAALAEDFFHALQPLKSAAEEGLRRE